MGNCTRKSCESQDVTLPPSASYVAMRKKLQPTASEYASYVTLQPTDSEHASIAKEKHQIELSHRRFWQRICGQVVVFLFSMLCMIPVISQWTWSPVVTGDCLASAPQNTFAPQNISNTQDATVVGACRVHPHSKQDMWFACAMLFIAKIFTLDTSKGFKSIVKQCLGMVAEYKEKTGLAGYLEWLLAIWNNYCAATFSCISIIQEHEARFTNGDLEPLFVRGSWFLTKNGIISAADDCKTFGTDVHSDAGLVDGALSYFGGIHLFLFMMGALFVSLAEIMKMDVSDEFLIKDWIDIDVLLRQNRKLENSPLMRKVKEAQVQLQSIASEVKSEEHREQRNKAMQSHQMMNAMAQPAVTPHNPMASMNVMASFNVMASQNAMIPQNPMSAQVLAGGLHVHDNVESLVAWGSGSEKLRTGDVGVVRGDAIGEDSGIRVLCDFPHMKSVSMLPGQLRKAMANSFPSGAYHHSVDANKLHGTIMPSSSDLRQSGHGHGHAADVEDEAARNIQEGLNNLVAGLLESIDKEEVIGFILKTDLTRVTWPFVLQASAFALWIAVDYVVLDPCVKFDSDIETKVLFGKLDLAGYFLPVVIWTSLLVIALGPITMLASSFCESAHWALFLSLASYGIFWGTFQNEMATTTDAASSGTATAKSTSVQRLDNFTADHIGAFFLLQLGLRPFNYERLIMVSYVGQCLLRQLVRLRTGCCKSMEPTDAQIEHFEVNVIQRVKREILDSIVVAFQGTGFVERIESSVKIYREIYRESEKAEWWYNLAVAGGDSVLGRAYSAQQCYIRALEIDPEFTNAWSGLGNEGGGSVRGRAYTAQQCYIRALEIDPESTNAWSGLGVAGGGSVRFRAYTAQHCCMRALEIDPENSIAWHGLGVAGGGSAATEQQCFIRAIEIDPDFKKAWYCLGNEGGGIVRGMSYTAQQCYIRALEIDPDFREAWSGLGVAGGGSVRGRAYTAQQCYIRAQ